MIVKKNWIAILSFFVVCGSILHASEGRFPSFAELERSRKAYLLEKYGMGPEQNFRHNQYGGSCSQQSSRYSDDDRMRPATINSTQQQNMLLQTQKIGGRPRNLQKKQQKLQKEKQPHKKLYTKISSEPDLVKCNKCGTIVNQTHFSRHRTNCPPRKKHRNMTMYYTILNRNSKVLVKCNHHDCIWTGDRRKFYNHYDLTHGHAQD